MSVSITIKIDHIHEELADPENHTGLTAEAFEEVFAFLSAVGAEITIERRG